MHVTILNWFYWLLMGLYSASGDPGYLQAAQQVPQYECIAIDWDGDRSVVTVVSEGVCK